MDAPNLPRPIEIAHQAEREFVELLLNWESDIAHGVFNSCAAATSTPVSSSTDGVAKPVWTVSAQVRGQLASLLRYLRSTVSADRISEADLLRVRHKLQEIERTRAQAREHARAREEVEERRRRRQVTQCLKQIAESTDQLEENLATLANALEILVPDPFAEHSDHISSPEPQSRGSVSDEQLRLHGHILGSSSGAGLISARGVVEVRLPGSMMISDRAHIPVPVELNEDIQTLADTAQECARLARDKHRPLLADWIKVLESANSDHSTDSTLNTKLSESLNRVRRWSARVNQLTHLFFDRIVWTRNGVPLKSAPEKQTVDVNTSDESSDASDMEEVAALSPLRVHSSAATNSMKSTTVPECNGGELSIELESAPDSSTKDSIDVKLKNKSSDDASTKPPHRPRSTVALDLFEVVPTKSSVVWRANESAHRFWRPIDPEEHEAQPEYMSDAISLSVPASSSGTAVVQQDTAMGDSASKSPDDVDDKAWSDEPGENLPLSSVYLRG
ncbi:unnamed protein product [Echinostoma caproni]|uniref:RUN domain-containing protein n=1 Tax=Echinostoma caproni TaxID=27848 RepID=A0A183A7F8_9TREM|nr:unnamed protein product [Echinostoma caproni]